MIALLVTSVSGGSWFDRLGPLFRSISWNALNQLISASKNGVLQASFQYDPLGRLVTKSTPTKVTTYTYDGADILRENVTMGGTTSSSYYLHGAGIDEPLSKETEGVPTYYHADGLGSIVKETSAAGAVTNTLRYDAWGNIEAGARDGFAFTGREWDPETGLYYYRARYYDSAQGRFLSGDPIGFAGGVNQYSYVLSSPPGLTDPSGLVPGTRFTTRNEAAMDAFLYIYGKSAATGGEWGGRICWDDCAKKYFVTEPKWNPQKPGMYPTAILEECPKGTRGLAGTTRIQIVPCSRIKTKTGSMVMAAYMSHNGDTYKYEAHHAPPKASFDTVISYRNRTQGKK